MGNTRSAKPSCFRVFQDACVAVASRGLRRELARRSVSRGKGVFRWFTTEEATVAKALADIIVPSDEEAPGLGDVDVLGPPAINALDELLAASAYRQHIYSRGLLSFDIWAMKERGCRFSDMAPEDQSMLLKAAERYRADLMTGPALRKAWRRLLSIAQVGGGRFFAAKLFPEIRSDCLQVFYTSRVSWAWLGYDGPPMDEGYPRLAPRR